MEAKELKMECGRFEELMIRIANNVTRQRNHARAICEYKCGLLDEEEYDIYINSDDCLIPDTDDVTDEELACLGMMAESGRIKLSKEELPVLLGMRNTHD